MCEKCRRNIVQMVVSQNQEAAYQGFLDGKFESEDEAVGSVVEYGASLYDAMVMYVGEHDEEEESFDDHVRH